MLVKIMLRDDPHSEVWINPTAISSIRMNKHSKDVGITMLGGEKYATKTEHGGEDLDPDLVFAINEQLVQG